MLNWPLIHRLFSKPALGLLVVEQVLKGMEFGSVTLKTSDGENFEFFGKNSGPNSTVIIHDWAGLRDIVRRGDIGLAEAYISQKIDLDSIAQFILWCCQNEQSLQKFIYGYKLSLLRYKLRHLLRANNKKQSRQNIEAHYDLGNNFYRLWLDPTKSYSSALYSNENLTLQQAQIQKYQRVLQQIQVQGHETVLEIGCGWGGFLNHLMTQTETQYVGLTLSTEQFDYCMDLIEKNQWQNRAKIFLKDYRDEKSIYDHIVSIEMVEAVGREFWPVYIKTLKECLKPGGRGLIQGICMNEKFFNDYIRGTDFIQQYIFPGGTLLSLNEFTAEMKKTGLEIKDCLSMGLSYAKTLNQWTAAFTSQKENILKLGFDERFYRMWLFYLGYCEGAFLANRTDVVQLTFQRPT